MFSHKRTNGDVKALMNIQNEALVYLQVKPHGAVASPSHQCSVVGTNILQDGGSAVDAAIATVMCEGVVSSHITGIGG